MSSLDSVIGVIMGVGIGRLLNWSCCEDIEYVMEEGLMEVLLRFEKCI